MRTPVLLLAAAAALGGCAGVRVPAATVQAPLQPTQGHEARGRVEFRQHGDAVEVLALVEGLRPGLHGFHIHERGDCSAPDASSAGGHFNPGGMPHGHPHAGQRHAGDMPNLAADANGRARLQVLLPGLRLDGGPAGIAGRAVVVHAAPDDYSSQPAGNAGARIACGVIAAR